VKHHLELNYGQETFMCPPFEQTIQVQDNNFVQYPYPVTDVSYIHRGTPNAFGYSNVPQQTSSIGPGPGYNWNPQFGCTNVSNQNNCAALIPSSTIFYPLSPYSKPTPEYQSDPTSVGGLNGDRVVIQTRLHSSDIASEIPHVNSNVMMEEDEPASSDDSACPASPAEDVNVEAENGINNNELINTFNSMTVSEDRHGHAEDSNKKDNDAQDLDPDQSKTSNGKAETVNVQANTEDFDNKSVALNHHGQVEDGILNATVDSNAHIHSVVARCKETQPAQSTPSYSNAGRSLIH